MRASVNNTAVKLDFFSSLEQKVTTRVLIITRASGGADVNKANVEKTRLKLDGFGGLEATRPRVAHTQHNNGAATR